MSNTPTDEELDSVLCHHWPAFSMQAVLVRMWLRDAMRAALAKWGTPQPVVREPLPPASPCAMTESEYRLFKLGWLEAEAAHGIKGGQHGADN